MEAGLVLYLNQYRVPGSSLKVSPSMNIETEALDGDTSISSRNLKGIKPKRLAISLQLRFDQTQELSDLTRKAEAITTKNTLVSYDLLNAVGNSMGIKQVQFTDSFSVTEVDTKKAWRIAFTLIEVNSVSEKTEERQGVVKGQNNQDAFVFDAAARQPQTNNTETESSFEQMYIDVDDLYGNIV